MSYIKNVHYLYIEVDNYVIIQVIQSITLMNSVLSTYSINLQNNQKYAVV
ncbi:hypothetical protein NEPAR06_1828 [Nematocida parisii]|uniref:Uncharacterized protein n=1 Tax=Nematocida parisii (strain ERTm3) TaxID=935791 RepID=I3EFT3_NEMP3|nr:hypothetical protein NEQG_01524 [Nematocida parisii ERTm3]KAI5145574.1 hypothetical protein NEPAR07_1780 [Nematocida parisii]KAI5155441.1 hypothetical protein NEPAR06_1828 [Nematocida parisii]